ncbi:MAG: TetR/AcrR family transcriptional regulator [Deltaproteobacteria bacterium]|nr:TetR/AcrR family transcriptional regulator [Deltaproteobacteria bacterium]
MGTTKDSEKTRKKLIESAGRLFSEKGFKGVTVRDIAKGAKTHLSALNYHFRSKDALYREVLLEACRSDAVSENDRKQLLKLDPKKALFLLVKESLKVYIARGPSNWRPVVLTRECRDPGPVFDEVVQNYFKPETDFLARIIGSAVEKSGQEPRVRFAALSMIGLLETFGLYGRLMEAVAPGMADHLKKKDEMARQIVHLVIEAADPSPR